MAMSVYLSTDAATASHGETDTSLHPSFHALLIPPTIQRLKTTRRACTKAACLQAIRTEATSISASSSQSTGPRPSRQGSFQDTSGEAPGCCLNRQLRTGNETDLRLGMTGEIDRAEPHRERR